MRWWFFILTAILLTTLFERISQPAYSCISLSMVHHVIKTKTVQWVHSASIFMSSVIVTVTVRTMPHINCRRAIKIRIHHFAQRLLKLPTTVDINVADISLLKHYGREW